MANTYLYVHSADGRVVLNVSNAEGFQDRRALAQLHLKFIYQHLSLNKYRSAFVSVAQALYCIEVFRQVDCIEMIGSRSTPRAVDIKCRWKVGNRTVLATTGAEHQGKKYNW